MRRLSLSAGETIIVGSDRGGVGKTMTAEIVATRIEAHGIRPDVVEVESDPRLQEVLGRDLVTTLHIANYGPEELERDPSLLYETWEALGDIVFKTVRPVVVDLGANLTKALAAYLSEVGEDGPFADGERLWFLGVTGGDRFSLSSVNHGLSYMNQAVPKSHRWLVVNEQNPRFQIATGSEPVQSMVRSHRLEGVMRLPACTSPVLQTVVDESRRIAVAADQDASFWVSRGYGQSEARRGTRQLRQFLAESMAMLDPIFPPLATREG